MVTALLYRLRRHPIAMTATLRHSLVVGYAFPRELLQRLLPPGLVVDAFGEEGRWGLAAVAVVRAERMRPAGLPAAVGRDYDLVGYRIFCRFRTPDGRLLRGLHILRSETGGRSMAVGGNLLTHYRYRLGEVSLDEADERLRVEVVSGDGGGDLAITASLSVPPARPPAGSPFVDLREARRFAGPLPFTFDHEPETGATVVIEGVRTGWHPQPVEVDVERATFFRGPMFGGAEPVLANAFHVAGAGYLWRRGRVFSPAVAA